MNSRTLNGLVFIVVGGIGGCSTVPFHDPQAVLPSYKEAYSASGPEALHCEKPVASSAGTTQFERFRNRLECAAVHEAARDEAKKAAELKRVLDEGMALSDQICSEFFSNLELRRREVEFGSTSVTATATAFTTVLSAAGTHARAVTNIAAALTGGTAILESYKVNFILTPDLYKVHQHIKVMRAERAVLNQSALADGGTSLSEVKQLLLAYDEACSVKAIQWVIREAVHAAQFGTKPAAGPVAEVTTGASTATPPPAPEHVTTLTPTARALGAQPALRGFGIIR